MIYGKDNFTFKPADFYPFKDIDEINRVRAITKEDMSLIPKGDKIARYLHLKSAE